VLGMCWRVSRRARAHAKPTHPTCLLAPVLPSRHRRRATTLIAPPMHQLGFMWLFVSPADAAGLQTPASGAGLATPATGAGTAPRSRLSHGSLAAFKTPASRTPGGASGAALRTAAKASGSRARLLTRTRHLLLLEVGLMQALTGCAAASPCMCCALWAAHSPTQGVKAVLL
jgi:hypothetical protein